jgi:hypothetical protein
VSTLALFVYTRHTADCSKRDDRFWKRCRCPKWIRGVVDSKTIRQTAHTRSWEKAEQLRKSMDGGGAPLPAVPLTIVQALADFIADAEMRNLAPGTLSKLKTLRGQLEAWAKERGLRYLKELTVAELSVFRSSWQDAGLSRKIKQQRLSSFFLFAIRNGWLTENPVKKLSRILVRDTPTDYFPEAEFLRTSRYAAGFMRRTNTALHRSTCALTNPFQAERGPVTSPKVENATFPGRWQCSRGATRVKPAQACRLRRSTRLDPVLYRLGLNFPAIRGMSLSNLNHSFVTRAGSESSVFMLSFSVRSLHEPANHT